MVLIGLFPVNLLSEADFVLNPLYFTIISTLSKHRISLNSSAATKVERKPSATLTSPFYS